MVNNTLKYHPDYDNLANAFSMVTQLYEYIQYSIEQAENQAHLLNVQRRLVITDPQMLDIFSGPRKFIEEGHCTLITGKNKKKRYLFLFDDLMLCTKPHTKATFRTKELFPLENLTYIESLPELLGKRE